MPDAIIGHAVVGDDGRYRVAFPSELARAYQLASMGDAQSVQLIMASHEAAIIEAAHANRRWLQTAHNCHQLQQQLNHLHGMRFSERVHSVLVIRARLADQRYRELAARVNRGWVGRALRALEVILNDTASPMLLRHTIRIDDNPARPYCFLDGRRITHGTYLRLRRHFIDNGTYRCARSYYHDNSHGQRLLTRECSGREYL